MRQRWRERRLKDPFIQRYAWKCIEQLQGLISCKGEVLDYQKRKDIFFRKNVSLHIPHAFNSLSPIKATGHTCVPPPKALVMFTLNARKTKPNFCLPSSCSNALASLCKLCFACTKITEVKFTEGMLGVLVLLSASHEPHGCKAPPTPLRPKEAMGSTLKS